MLKSLIVASTLLSTVAMGKVIDCPLQKTITSILDTKDIEIVFTKDVTIPAKVDRFILNEPGWGRMNFELEFNRKKRVIKAGRVFKIDSAVEQTREDFRKVDTLLTIENSKQLKSLTLEGIQTPGNFDSFFGKPRSASSFDDVANIVCKTQEPVELFVEVDPIVVR